MILNICKDDNGMLIGLYSGEAEAVPRTGEFVDIECKTYKVIKVLHVVAFSKLNVTVVVIPI